MNAEGNMNKPLMKTIVIVLIVAIGGVSGCKKAEIVSEADVLGTWEIKAWNWDEPQYYSNYDMRGTLVFSLVSYEGWRGVRVDCTFKQDGSVQILSGYASLTNLPIITFECYFGSIFPDNLAFRGIVEDGGMIGSGGFYWDIPSSYTRWEWEAVKK
jgi:hypothetical protein